MDGGWLSVNFFNILFYFICLPTPPQHPQRSPETLRKLQYIVFVFTLLLPARWMDGNENIYYCLLEERLEDGVRKMGFRMLRHTPDKKTAFHSQSQWASSSGVEEN